MLRCRPLAAGCRRCPSARPAGAAALVARARSSGGASASSGLRFLAHLWAEAAGSPGGSVRSPGRGGSAPAAAGPAALGAGRQQPAPEEDGAAGRASAAPRSPHARPPPGASGAAPPRPGPSTGR